MTSQEEAMLNDLVRKINGTSLQEKDDQAENLLNSGLGRNPDAMYMLAQTVLVQNIALEQAKQQMQALQQQAAAPQPSRATSFLGSLLGHHDPQPQTQPPAQSANQGYQQVQYAQPGQQFAPPAQGGYQPAASGQPSFLRSAATTAAGVAAGALAFEGVSSLLHGGGGGFGVGGFGGGGFGGGGFGEAPREEIVNNYYDSPGGAGSGSGPDEQPQGPYDNGAQDVSSGNDGNYGDDFSDGGGDFGGDDDTNFS